MSSHTEPEFTPEQPRTMDAFEPVSPGVEANYQPLVANRPLGRTKRANPTLKLSTYFDDLAGIKEKLPTSTNFREKAKGILAEMYLNNRYGCCEISALAHLIGQWTSNASAAMHATDKEIYDQYQKICGRGDNGCFTQNLIAAALRGFTVGGQVYKAEAAVGFDWTNKLQVQTVIATFGGGLLGFALPRSYHSSANNSTWGPVNGRTVGGHMISLVDYTEKGVIISTWGGLRLYLWEAFLSKKYIDETWFMVNKAWVKANGKTPSGFNMAKMLADAAIIRSGKVPAFEPDPEVSPIVWDAPPPPITSIEQ